MTRLFLIFAVAATLAGCGTKSSVTVAGKGEPGRPRVAVITNCTAEFWSICEAGAKKGAADHGVDVQFIQPEKMEVSVQMQQIDAVMKTGVKGLAVSVINPKEQTPDLKRIGSRVQLITMDNDATDTGRLCYVGINNYDAGKAVGRLVKKALPNGGTIAVFIGSTTSANAKDRIAGTLDELAGSDNRAAIADGKFAESYGKYKLFRKMAIEDAGEENKALDNAKDVIEQLKGTPDVCLVGLYAYNPKCILEASRSKKTTDMFKIVGFDEDTVTLDGIARGEIVGTVVQDPFNYGYESVRLLAMLAKTGDTSQLPKQPTPYRVVTKDGGPDETVNGQTIKVTKAVEYAQKIKDDLASVKK